MNRDQLYKYFAYPEKLDAESLSGIEVLVGEYPYFQAARMLYVKNLKNLDSISFNKQLRTASAYINNRQFLFALLNDISVTDDGYFEPRLPLKEVETDFMELTDEAGILSLDPHFDSKYIDNLEPDIAPPEGKSLYVRELERFIPLADLDLLLFDHSQEEKEILDFDFEGKLPEIAPKPADEERDITVDKPRKVSSRDLIDDFIRKNPRMPKPADSEDHGDDISMESMQESDAFMTETMAQIYLKQGYYYKALNTYEKLSLKYPEKSVYFATQIQKIKELISNK
jgi:hypothetical protein